MKFLLATAIVAATLVGSAFAEAAGFLLAAAIVAAALVCSDFADTAVFAAVLVAAGVFSCCCHCFCHNCFSNSCCH